MGWIEITRFLLSDVSGRPINELITPHGLWMLNSVGHFFMGSALFLLETFPQGRWAGRVVSLTITLFLALQVIQVFMDGPSMLLVAEGIFHFLVLMAGWAATYWIVMRSPVWDRG